MKRGLVARINFHRWSIAFVSFAIAVCVYTLWTPERSSKIDQPGVWIEETTLSALPELKSAPTISPTPSSPIRSIDFGNFTYPEIEGRGTFTLQDGHEPNVVDRRSIVDIVYGDVTSDGLEDAMVVQSQSIRGSAIPYFVYVYSINSTRARLLWSFYAGERGDGGLRQISSNGGRMVVELYGRDRTVSGGSSSEADNVGLCCPPFFTRSCYEWRGGGFRLKTKEAQLPNPQGSAIYLPLLRRFNSQPRIVMATELDEM